MAGNSNQIIVGPAQMFIDGVDVGFTTGGVTLRKATDWLDVEADQTKGVMRKEPTMERMFVSTTMLEATRDNMRRAMNEAATQAWSGSALALGSPNPVAVEHTVTLIGTGPSGKTRTYVFTRAIASEEVEHMAGARDAVSSLPIGMELLKDENYGSTFGYMHEQDA